MTNAQALEWGQQVLSQNEIATARLDALVLLEDNQKIDRAHLLAEPQEKVPASALKNYTKQIRQRAKHLPLAYVRGKSEFYGREFLINHHVLEPRPESEAIIDELKVIIGAKAGPVIDVGTGSGALIISASLELGALKTYATDISKACLDLAAKNAARHGVTPNFYRGDLIKPLPQAAWRQNSVLLANLPYVPSSWQINPAAMREPRIAIFGGHDGLRLYERLFKQIDGLEIPPLWVLVEAMPPQHANLIKVASPYGYRLNKVNDFILVFKRYGPE